MENEEIKGFLIKHKGIVKMIMFAIVFFMFLNPVKYIAVGHKGVVMKFGAVSDRVLGEGINFIVPIADSVQEISVQIRKSEYKSQSASKDLQIVETELALNYHLSDVSVQHVFKNIGLGYEEKIIMPAVLEVLKSVTAQYTASELITKRDIVSMQIKDTLALKLKTYNILVDEISVKDFDFSKSFNDSIELKQKAEQDALRAENDLRRIKVEAEQVVAQAKAEAESLRVKSQQLTPLMVKLEQIKAWEKGGSKVPQYMSCGSKESMFINLPKE